MSQRLRMLKTN